MTPSPTTGHRFTTGIVSGLLTLLLTASVLTPHAHAQEPDRQPAQIPAQQPADPVPAPVIRPGRHPPAQIAPGTATPKMAAPKTTPAAGPKTAQVASGSTGITGQTARTAQTQTPAPVLHRPRPVPSLLPGTTPATDPATTLHPTHPATPMPVAAKPTTPQIAHHAPATSPTTSPAKTIPARTVKPSTEHPSNTVHGLNRNVVVIDPGHGGTDSGARIGDNTLEKNVTLALAFRLRSLLLARGFTVILTRDSDAATLQATSNAAPTPLTLDDRAGIANHAHAAACLLLHATGRGTGLHLYNPEIAPIPAEPYLVPWLTGQAAWVPASNALEAGIRTALGRSGIPQLASTASVRPVDSLICPALVLELAPENDTPASINDAGYQERVASALAGALVVWESAVQPPPRLPAPVHLTHHTENPEAPASTPAVPSPPETQP